MFTKVVQRVFEYSAEPNKPPHCTKPSLSLLYEFKAILSPSLRIGEALFLSAALI